MSIYQSGTLNTTALVVPGVYIQIVPPGILNLNGTPSNRIGIVGTATWGPVGTPTTCSGSSDCSTYFGALQARKYDLGTAVAVAAGQGANVFTCVRATDGTDTAATLAVGTSITFTARYTGTLGNTISVTLSAGSKASTVKAVVAIGVGLTTRTTTPPEVFDNIPGTGNALWVAMAAAINNGIGQRGPSLIITATAGVATTAPTLGTPYALAGGTDGASTATAVAASPAILLGTDTLPRTGIYALRKSGCSIGMVADMDTSSAWTTIDGLGAQEGIYMIQCGPSGDTVANAVTTKASAGLDSPSSKYLHGDWLWWIDGVNSVTRLVSPQGFAAGRLGNLAPNQSGLNKPMANIAGSQKSGLVGTSQAQTYSDADNATLFSAGIDVIANPSPGGTYWGMQLGHNSSSNAAINGDSYTRMVNYMAATLNAGTGKFVGQPITPQFFLNVTATLNQYFGALVQGGLLSTAYGLPYAVTCNTTNNPQSRTALGYFQADVQVTLEGIAEKVLINLQAGATVQITTPLTPSAQGS